MKTSRLKPCLYSKANFLSRLSIWWMNPIFTKGYDQKLKATDLNEVADNDKSDYLTTDLERNWEKELLKACHGNYLPSFSKAFIRTYLWKFLIAGVYAILCECSRCLLPFLIGELTVYFTNYKTMEEWYAIAISSGIALSAVFAVSFSQLYFTTVSTLGWNARTAIVGLMYKKTLKLHGKALSQTSTGKIVNLSSTDAMRYDFAFYFAHYLWISPVECIVVAYVLWTKLGQAAFVGMGVLFLIMIIQAFIGKLFGKFRLAAAKATDQRVHIMSEVIAAMRVIKMYSWEKSFHEIISLLRKKEMRKIFFASLVRSFNYTATHATGQTLSFATFLAFAALQGHLSLQVVFIAVGLFSIMRVGVGVFFPMAMEKFFETKVALKRTEEFLLLPEKEPLSDESNDEEKKGSFVKLHNFTAAWNEDENVPTLSDVTLEVYPGKLLMVVGSVGSGKSSLLSAILGELPALSGSVRVRGKIAYSSQISWLVSGDIRSNILFGEKFDEQRYNEVVKVCALQRDFEILPHGDATEVGERGVTLSGGQKARVGLARAAYSSNTDIVLFDDPLSAVDPSVANHLFSHCICSYMKEKARVLVTHQLHFLEKSDQIIVLKEGKVVDKGTYDELKAKGTDFSSFVKAQDDDDCLSPELGETIIDNVPKQMNGLGGEKSTEDKTNAAASAQVEEIEVVENNDSEQATLLPKTKIIDNGKSGKPPLEEKKPAEDKNVLEKKGKLNFRIYYRYFKSGVFASFLLVLLVFVIISHILMVFSDWWLAQWARAAEEFYKNAPNPPAPMPLDRARIAEAEISATFNDTANTNFSSTSVVTPLMVTFAYSTFDRHYYTTLYAILTTGFLLSMFIRTAMHFYLCVQSSIHLHSGMLSAILKAKIRFFDINPVGSVLNRFSKDLNQADELLPYAFMDVIFMWGSILTILIFIITINYFSALVIIPMTIYFFWVRKYYVSTSREVKRIEGANRSPVFGHLSSTLQGLVLIRTFGTQENFTKKYHDLQDTHGAAWAAFVYGSRWIAFRLDIVTAFFIGSCAFLSVALVLLVPDGSVINAGSLGLTLTYSITLATVIQYSVRQSAEAENLMTSVERIYEYHDIPPEANEENKKNVNSYWPNEGALSLVDVSFAYYEGGPIVLKNVNLEIKAREKLGVVGRTGAGKSSLIASIFCMSDQITGLISIDGVDTSQIKLHDLRSVLAIIPQDPVLFGATMRKNLDAFSDYTDEQLWNALEQVQLKPLVEQLPLKLETKLSESGSNLSVGQRQLVCLARAILRNNRILVIDEATANVDLRTDQLIQETIRERFSECTVITVAHRLNTIVHSDRILVLDDGRRVECDRPHILLQDERSTFSEMVRMTGDHEEDLREAAQRAYYKHHSVEA